MGTRGLVEKGSFSLVRDGTSVDVWARAWVPWIDWGIPKVAFNLCYPSTINSPWTSFS